jgi:hypothetical protein
MRSHARAETARRVRHIREAILSAVALHREWVAKHDTDDDDETGGVPLDDLLPGTDVWDRSEIIAAATWAGFPVDHDEDGLLICIGTPRAN